MKLICRICGAKGVKIVIKHPFFRHIDYKTVKKSATMIKCSVCQSVFNPYYYLNGCKDFVSKEYANTSQTQHIIKLKKNRSQVTRSFLQAKLIAEMCEHRLKKPRILDIGCFDGLFLKHVNEMLSGAELWGYDINQKVEPVFPKRNNFHFITSKLSEIDGPFDVITLSHSIFYFSNITELINTINCNLKNRGILFIQIPDIIKNPVYALMGDQQFIFTSNSLLNIFNNLGYRIEVIKNDNFPREVLIVGKKQHKRTETKYKKDKSIERAISAMDQMKMKLESLDSHQLFVLGTTASAAYVDEIIGGRIKLFVDENTSKTKFRGKSVIHPESLKRTDQTIIPYGKTGYEIQRRLKKHYHGHYFVL